MVEIGEMTSQRRRQSGASIWASGIGQRDNDDTVRGTVDGGKVALETQQIEVDCRSATASGRQWYGVKMTTAGRRQSANLAGSRRCTDDDGRETMEPQHLCNNSE